MKLCTGKFQIMNLLFMIPMFTNYHYVHECHDVMTAPVGVNDVSVRDWLVHHLLSTTTPEYCSISLQQQVTVL